MFSVFPFLWTHFASVITIWLRPVLKERIRESRIREAEAFQGKVDQKHTQCSALLGTTFRPYAACVEVDSWWVLWFRVHCSAKSIHHRAFPANIFEVTGLPDFTKTSSPNNYMQAVMCNVTLGLGGGWDEQSPVTLAALPGEKAGVRNSALLQLLSLTRPLQAGKKNSCLK